jgi:hypothetical protein
MQTSALTIRHQRDLSHAGQQLANAPLLARHKGGDIDFFACGAVDRRHNVVTVAPR